MPSRRKVLTVAGTGIGASLAGCLGVLGSDADINITVANYRETPVDVVITLRKSGDRDGEAIHRVRMKAPRMSGEEDMLRMENIVPARDYRVEVAVEDIDEERVYRYESTCSEDESDGIGFRIEIYADDIRFHQSNCSDGPLS